MIISIKILILFFENHIDDITKQNAEFQEVITH